MKKNRVFLNTTSVICFIYGALYCFSLVFIPIGIYCFVAGKIFANKADHLLDNFSTDKKTMKAYTIFVSFFCFPFGLLSIIAYIGLYGNNVKVQGFNYEKITEVNPVAESKNDDKQQTSEQIEETEADKMAKFEKLKNFREKNIITEEEFEMAKEQMFGKDKK